MVNVRDYGNEYSLHAVCFLKKHTNNQFLFLVLHLRVFLPEWTKDLMYAIISSRASTRI